VVRKNENYYNADQINLDGIDFAMIEERNTAWQMYQNGELHVEFDLPPDILAEQRNQNNPELIIGDELAVYFYRFNTSVKPFNNVKVRKALSMAIDRESIVNEVAQGGQRPAFGIVPPGIPMPNGRDYEETVGPYFTEDVVQAKKLLAEGLAEEGMTNLSFTILYNTSEGHKLLAEAIQEMWNRNLGITAQLENTDFQIKIDREHALDYQVSRAGWIGDYVDPMTFLDMWESASTQNDTGWTDENFDRKINNAKTEFNENERFELMMEAERIFMDQMPVMPIYHYTRPYVVKPNVTGITKVVNRDISAIYADIQ
jgi:oligopeptide transport system substrate-binding protein